MSENTSKHEGEPDIGPSEPPTSAERFVADHFRFWLHKGQTLPEQLPGAADLVVLTDLPNHAEVNPDLRMSIDPYPPMRSQVPPLNLGNIVEQIRAMQAGPSGS